MANQTITDDLKAHIREVYAETGDATETAKRCGVNWHTAKKYGCEVAREAAPEQQPDPDAPVDVKRVESADFSTVEFRIGKRIRTADEAMDYAEVDRKVWRLRDFQCTYWETGLKLTTRNEQGRILAERPHQTQQWRVMIRLERILPKSLQDATEAFFAAMQAYSPKYPTIARVVPKRPHLCVVDLFDVHFGKLAWRLETGEDYDLRIAEMLYRNAVQDILHESAHRQIGEFVVPIGNDFFHVDSQQNQTTAGTPQDVDGRLAKIIETGERAVIWAIEQLAAVAPVRTLWVPGNHDRLLSYTLVRTLSAWFRSCDEVVVDLSPKLRKSHRFGKTLVGFTHGNEEPLASLAGIMANEWREDWALTDTHEWHRGHRHRPKKMETTPVNFVDGITIRDLMSLSALDAWHYARGYVGGKRAAEAYFYGKDEGFVAQYVAKARVA